MSEFLGFSQFLRAARAGHRLIQWPASKGFRFNQWKTDNMQILAPNWSIPPYFNHHCHQLVETRSTIMDHRHPPAKGQTGITDKIQRDGREDQSRIQTDISVGNYRLADQSRNTDRQISRKLQTCRSFQKYRETDQSRNTDMHISPGLQTNRSARKKRQIYQSGIHSTP